MKLKTVQAIIKQSRSIGLVNGPDEQWITDGAAAYPLRGLPEMKLSNLQSFFDMTDKQWDKVSAKYLELPLCLDDSCDEDEETEFVPIDITWYGSTFKPIMCDGVCHYVKSSYLKPFSDEALYFIRKNDRGECCIAVREGFFLVGLIMPVQMQQQYVGDVKKMIEATVPEEPKGKDGEPV